MATPSGCKWRSCLSCVKQIEAKPCKQFGADVSTCCCCVHRQPRRRVPLSVRRVHYSADWLDTPIAASNSGRWGSAALESVDTVRAGGSGDFSPLVHVKVSSMTQHANLFLLFIFSVCETEVSHFKFFTALLTSRQSSPLITAQLNTPSGTLTHNQQTKRYLV